MMFFIPILVLLGVMVFALGGNVVQDLKFNLSLPDVSKYLTPQFKSSEQNPSSSNAQKSPVYTGTKIAPRSPQPPAPEPQQEQTTVSPYAGKVTLSNFKATNGSQPFSVTLQPRFSSTSVVSITGWRIKSKMTSEATIGQGIELFHPVFSTEPIENIRITANDTVYVTGGNSPLGREKNFRPNACFGYLQQYYSLPGSYSCSQDKPPLEAVSNLSPACQDFILKDINYSSCTVPDMGALGVNQECVSYVQNPSTGFNYQGCYNKHSGESNFVKNEWRVYLHTTLGHYLHDTITLYDQNGLVVDTYIY